MALIARAHAVKLLKSIHHMLMFSLKTSMVNPEQNDTNWPFYLFGIFFPKHTSTHERTQKNPYFKGFSFFQKHAKGNCHSCKGSLFLRCFLDLYPCYKGFFEACPGTWGGLCFFSTALPLVARGPCCKGLVHQAGPLVARAWCCCPCCKGWLTPPSTDGRQLLGSCRRACPNTKCAFPSRWLLAAPPSLPARLPGRCPCCHPNKEHLGTWPRQSCPMSHTFP